MLSHLRFVAHICVGLLFGGLCWQIGNDASKIDQNVSFIFLSMLFLLFSSLMPTLMQFPADINVMIAEYRNRWYSSGAYFLAKTLSDLPFSILFDMLFTVIGTIPTKIHRKCQKWPMFQQSGRSGLNDLLLNDQQLWTTSRKNMPTKYDI